MGLRLVVELPFFKFFDPVEDFPAHYDHKGGEEKPRNIKLRQLAKFLCFPDPLPSVPSSFYSKIFNYEVVYLFDEEVGKFIQN